LYENWPYATQTGLSEGFHVLRARAFLKRDGQASLYNTFTQTFYYDAKTPDGSIAWPQNNNDEISGSSYELVVRTDSTVEAGVDDFRIDTYTCNLNNPADLNNTGMVGGDDLGLMLSNWGGSGIGDLNNDGVVGGDDLGQLLAAWSN
jgi:hypothetical protein